MKTPLKTRDGDKYRGRIAPSPTGFLHLGHGRTFWTAAERCREAKGSLVLRNEDLDSVRCRTAFITAMFEDLRWFGLDWSEGPDLGGPFFPYNQSECLTLYRNTFARLREAGFLYPCSCSRKDVLRALTAPHTSDEEPIYPGTCRDTTPIDPANAKTNWRFRVPDGETVTFEDRSLGPQSFVAGRDFGDFVVWRHDDLPSYQLAVVVDDARMKITEVVRGADLLLSTARQILLYRALAETVPRFFHCPLVLDASGKRLAKRTDALSLRTLRARGYSPDQIRSQWA